MSKDSQNFSPRSQKKKSGRDGMLALMFVALIAIIIIVLIVFGIKAIADRNTHSQTTSSTDPVVPIFTTGTTPIIATTDSTSVATTVSTPVATTAVTESTTTPVIIDPTNYKNEQMSANEIYNGNLIVIDENNAYHNVTPTSDNDRIVSLYNKSGFHTSYWLRNSKIGARYGIIGDLDELLTRFRIQFPDVFMTGSKTLIYAGAPLAGSTAVVDYTNENTSGLGIDLRVYTSDGKVRKLSYSEYTWIAANCAEYGFIISDPSDPYHLRYVGKVHAKYITDNGLTLSEYVSLVKSYTYASPLKMVSSGSVYSVYYVRSTGDMTNVSVPIGKDYTISGNNIDGFIVTVKG